MVIADQAGFHLPSADLRVPTNVRLPPLPPQSPELNPVECFGGLLKAAVDNHLFAASKARTRRAAVSGLINSWLADQANSGASA